jgi:hypothetical protein
VYFPFEVGEYVIPARSLKLGDELELPCYGSLTVEEAILLSNFYSLQDPFADPLATRFMLATLVLQCRIDPVWTMQQTIGLPLQWLEEIVQFFLGEQRRWEEVDQPRDEQTPTKKQKPTDWASKYWELKRLYPHEKCFWKANFAKCPIWLIEQALNEAERAEVERLSLEGRAIANLGVMMAAANAVKNPKTTWFNDFEHVLYRQKAREDISPEVAQSFMRLHTLGKVPEWVCEVADLDLIRASASWLEVA